jgi:hypothetical protein
MVIAKNKVRITQILVIWRSPVNITDLTGKLIAINSSTALIFVS